MKHLFCGFLLQSSLYAATSNLRFAQSVQTLSVDKNIRIGKFETGLLTRSGTTYSQKNALNFTLHKSGFYP